MNMRHWSFLLATALLGSVLGFAQALPPGQLPPGPPPQPGQLGPAPSTLPPDQPTPNPQQQKIEDQATPSPDATDQGPLIGKSVVRYVLVPTTVFDPDGHGYVNGLTKRDFELLDNGKAQKISTETTQQPVSVVLAVQANSEVEPVIPTLQKTGLLLHGLVTGEQGDVAVLAFDHRMQVLQDFTDNPDKLDDAMHRLRSGSSTAALIDAVMKADEMLRTHDRQNSRRRVVVLLSRNMDHGSQLHLQEAIHRMQFDNIIVYCVDISKWKAFLLKKPDYPRPDYGGIPPEAQGSITGQPRTATNNIQEHDGNWLNTVPLVYNGVKDLFKRSPAEAFTYFTGGTLYNFSTERALEAAITDIGQNLNSQYLLSYALSNTEDPGFHTIKVNVDRPGLKIKTRPGYWWGGGQQ